MRQKTQQETAAAEKQVELLVSALEKAKSNGGVWMNPGGHPRPKMYPNGVNVSPFNAMVMALHADANGCRMPLYMTFNTAKSRDLAVMKGEKGVPFMWYNWDTFVNRDNPDNKISRDTYNALPESVQSNYRAMQKREVNTVFNIDQTTFEAVASEEYEKLKQVYGSAEMRKADLKGLKTQVAHFLLTMRENLVRVQHNGKLSEARYDHARDAVYIPNQKVYPQYEDFARDAIRQIMMATGHEQRLARVSQATPEATKQEALITELAAGIKMLELGLPAKISKENLQHIDYWKQELQTNPCLIDIIERDMNTSLDIIGKAERGEKVEYASKERQEQTEQLKTPDVTSEECAILLDIVRRGGYEIDSRNFTTDKAYKQFLKKFGLTTYETDKLFALSEMRKPSLPAEDREKVEAVYHTNAAEIARICRESVPQRWNDKASHYFIQKSINQYPNNETNVVVIVKDKNTKVADVVLGPGASLAPGKKSGSNLSRLETVVLKDVGASYVRFFTTEGFMGYHPDDSYFQNKTVSADQLKGWKMLVVADFQIYDAVTKAQNIVFEHAQVLRDDNGQWSIYLKPHGEDAFAIHPDSKEINQFFTTLRNVNEEEANKVKDEIAQKYYIVGKMNPARKFDIFGMNAPLADIDRISRVSVFPTKSGKWMLAATIEGCDKLRAREITKEQWQRVRYVDDKDAYRKHLAAKVYSDMMHPEVRLHEDESITPLKETGDDDREEQKEQQEHKEPTRFVNLDSLVIMKAKFPDMVLLFRINDKFEAYRDDAKECSSLLGLKAVPKVITDEKQTASVVEFPVSDLDKYLPQFVRAGKRIIICDNPEDFRRVLPTYQEPTKGESEQQARSFHR